MYKKFIKRFLDLILSLMALILLMPLMLIIYILVRVKLGKPAIFKQERPGKDEKIFTLYKFRTMTDEKDENGNLLPDEQRLTKFGKMLRSTSLDELPELVNIIKGDMSIVGPRPLADCYLPWYNGREKHRHDVRPGLTGLAQVNGRNHLNWDQRFEYDVTYVENISLLLDIKIILKTVAKVLKRTDVQLAGTGEIINFDIYRQEQLKNKSKIKKEIGSNFYEYSTEKEVNDNYHPIKEYDNEQFFVSGRNAILALCKSLETENKIALLPDFTCETVIKPFEQAGWKFEFYRIKKNLTIDIKDLKKKIKNINPSIVLVHAYYGFNSYKSVKQAINKLKNVVIVEDITQDIFSDFSKIKANYYVTSLRKFFAIPDGGMLITPKGGKQLAIEYSNTKNDIYKIAVQAFNDKKNYIENLDSSVVKNEFLEKYKKIKQQIDKIDDVEIISEISKDIFSNIDIKNIKKKRQRNYKFLLSELKDIENINIIFNKISEQEVPLYFPIYVREDREKFQKYMAENEIYCPIIWKKSQYIKDEKQRESDYIYEHILCVPCDQRYDIDDMERIVRTMKKYKD